MARRVALALVLSLLLCGPEAWAGKKGNAPPLNATWLPPQVELITSVTGVFDDGNASYDNGIENVQCYFGVNGSNVNLITYNTPRELHLVFDTSSTAWQNSKLPSELDSTVTLFGVNYYGQFESMGWGTTAQLQMDIEFKYGSLTYEVTYASIAAYRDLTLDPSGNTWLITSDPYDLPGNPGFTASPQAVLSAIKRHSQQTFGTVTMPVRFEVTLQ
jgi:hypothetical protein